VFSCIAELCWYLSGSERVEPIEFYLPRYREDAEPDGTIHGAYGPRLLRFNGVNQIDHIIDTLRRRPGSRQAVIQIFDHDDVSKPYKHVPCTCTLQFFVRSGRLDAIVHMRSNDVYVGMPHDIFCFTMIQELLARSLDVELGTYAHMVGSLHLYEGDLAAARAFLNEGWQGHIEMPAMPLGDPWPSVQRLVALEEDFRTGGADPLATDLKGEPYWNDLATLLALYALHSQSRKSEMGLLRKRLNNDVYGVFVSDRFGLL
jgi:thymidylate synthase